MGETIYREYDRAALDAQYSARNRIANYEGYMERWPQESAAARERLRLVADVRYGKHPLETYDVFPAGRGAPVHVFYHGGYWYSQDKHVFEFMAPAFVAAGATCVSVNYPLCPGVSLTHLVQSVRAALAHVWQNAHAWEADADRVYISGHSAGGHIVAMLMATDWPAEDDDLPADLVKGGLAISGLYDLAPISRCYVNDNLHLTEQEVTDLSPVRHLPRGGGALALAVGGEESPEFHRQQEVYATAVAKAGTAPQIIDMPGHDHFSIMDDLASPQGRLFAVARAQMGLG